MTGGGFGGCTVNLVEVKAVDDFRAAVRDGYRKAVGREPEIYVSSPAAGARELINSRKSRERREKSGLGVIKELKLKSGASDATTRGPRSGPSASFAHFCG